ncbi:type VI secretion system tube protein Hcp [Lutibacter sp.]|uniref:type VI secretion system tube protein Hcp n=1 Tax=Lutibacter sp. TaxID=1925666 RepID=UPI001A1B3260|nr:type VI secretion system tube protein Hcp [Lutibacter sp.]MBI9042815.1 type VI secretion system tube protein Hcp [Lutibacter sp.]
MKTKLLVVVLVAITCVTSQLFAQETLAKTAGYDLKKNIKCRVTATETGYFVAFAFHNKPSATQIEIIGKGKRLHEPAVFIKEYSVAATDNTVTEVVSPRDAASGLPTGKRQHSPLTIKSEIDKSSPQLLNAVSSDVAVDDTSASILGGGGAGKAVFKEFTITKRCGGESTQYIVVDSECTIPTGDCPDGTCTLTVDWSWGATNSGSSNTAVVETERSSRAVDFFLKIEDGVCVDHAINTKGAGGNRTKSK